MKHRLHRYQNKEEDMVATIEAEEEEEDMADEGEIQLLAITAANKGIYPGISLFHLSSIVCTVRSRATL